MKLHHAYQIANMKAALVERVLSGHISVTEAAASMKKSRVAFYKWIAKYKAGGIEGLLPQKTGPRGGQAWNRSSEETESIVLALCANQPTWNIYDIAAHLPSKYAVHPSTVYRIWKRHQRHRATIRLPRPKPQLYIKDLAGEELQLDSCFPWGRGMPVCFDCLDDHSRFALARIYANGSQDSAISFLHYVIAHAPFVIRRIRTDCGKEFGTRFSRACETAGIEHIRNEPYHPEHNGKIEKFHDGLKYRCCYVYLHPRDPLARLNSDLQQWLTWYNFHKTHSGLGMHRRTPAEVVRQSLLANSSCVNLMLQPNTV